MDATATIGGGVPLGTPVFDVAGEKIGALSGADPYVLVVGRGFFIPRAYPVALAAVDRYEDGKLFLNVTKAQVVAGHDGRT